MRLTNDQIERICRVAHGIGDEHVRVHLFGSRLGDTADSDLVNYASHLLSRTALASKPVLHGDKRSTPKATTVLAMLNWLGVEPSNSRPRVIDDNACAESLFRTAKYRPEFPAIGFTKLDHARACAASFVQWDNINHRHVGVRYVSPAQRRAGEDYAILTVRQTLYATAQKLPAHWPGNVRNWPPIYAMTRNLERDCVVSATWAQIPLQPLVA